MAWASANELEQAVAAISRRDGPNAVTRQALLTELASITDFDAGGWFGPRPQRALSPCYVLLQVRDGAFARAYPEAPGTFDCDPANLQAIAVDPAADGTG
jgi:hypothetical protein